MRANVNRYTCSKCGIDVWVNLPLCSVCLERDTKECSEEDGLAGLAYSKDADAICAIVKILANSSKDSIPRIMSGVAAYLNYR